MRKVTLTDDEVDFILWHAEARIKSASNVLTADYQAQFLGRLNDDELADVVRNRKAEINELKTLVRKVTGK